ncbi:DUF4435 domain-containing protein [Aeromonas enteropelogenes]|uniref:DUF4435 domain-containing protein n=1 Tax=Aeromonas enteropelogenes TaxID=29489 RepID=UPI003B9EB790
MQYDIEEIFTQSIMTKKPYVIVEGIDDISIYDRIINTESKSVEIIAVETIEGFTKGCDSIVNVAMSLEKISNEKYDPSNYILGIIDKDVRDFRGELPQYNTLLTLNVYSIESHFINSDVINHILKTCTKGTADLFTSHLREKILNECIKSMEILYLASLDALKGALDRNYSSDFGYCQTYGRLKDQNLSEKLINKKNDLYSFAAEHSISSDLDSLKKICKGKWLLSMFCEELERSIKKLSSECGVSPVTVCQMCVIEAKSSCLYRLSEGFTHKTMREIAKQVCNSTELSYIKKRVGQLRVQAA